MWLSKVELTLLNIQLISSRGIIDSRRTTRSVRMHGQTIESTDLFDNDWQKRAKDIHDDDLMQINTFGRMLVALSLSRTDYFTKLLSKTNENTVMVMFSTGAKQLEVLGKLREKLCKGEVPTDQDLREVPIRAVPDDMKRMLSRAAQGITELRRRLEDVHKQYEIDYIVFVMLGPEDGEDHGTYFIGSLLTKMSLTLEVKRTLVCLSCGAQGSEKKALKKCARCKDALYCSKECQTKDWPQHRRKCPLTHV